MMRVQKNRLNPDYFRNLIFGVEDSLVSTVGVLFGIASANYDQKTIVFTGLIVISVEALSMGAGAYLSETSSHDLDEAKTHSDKPVISGIIMFFAYFLSGYIPLAPYLLINSANARFISLILAIVSLFLLGYFPKRNLKSATRMTVVAGLAVLIGFLIGNLAKVYL